MLKPDDSAAITLSTYAEALCEVEAAVLGGTRPVPAALAAQVLAMRLAETGLAAVPGMPDPANAKDAGTGERAQRDWARGETYDATQEISGIAAGAGNADFVLAARSVFRGTKPEGTMRILCLDKGTKRKGMAASDPMGWTAQPLGVLTRRGGSRDFESIADEVRKLGADMVLVGLPLDAEGGEGPQAVKVRAFALRLEAHFREAGIGARMEYWDERYSTATARERLIEADVSRARRRRVIDKMAAAVILEDYLRARPG